MSSGPTLKAEASEQSGNFEIDLWDDGYAGTDPTDYLLGTLFHRSRPAPVEIWRVGSMKIWTPWSMKPTRSMRPAARKPSAKWQLLSTEEIPIIELFTIPNADAYSARLVNIQDSINDLVTWNIAEWTIK